jgi:small-conductance mechanosensitive channel
VAAGALLLTLLALRAVGRLTRLGRVRLRHAAAARKLRLTVGGLSLLDRVRLQRWTHWLMIALSRAIGITLVYLWVVFALRQFPYTRPWSELAGTFVLENVQSALHALLRSLPGLLTVVLIAIVARWLSRLSGSFFALVENRGVDLPWFHPDLAQPTRRIATAVLWVFAAVLAYPFIPFSDSVAFKGVSILVGVMLSLGSSGVVNQAMSGLVLMYSRALRVGEFVRIGGVEGTVTSLGILSTKIRTLKGEEETVPNSVVVGTSTTNYSRLGDEHALLLYTSLTIGYDTPWRQVHALLALAAGRTAGLLAEPAPFVLQRALSDFYVEYQINARLERPEQRPAVLSRLHANIQDVFNEHGVQIMSPHYLGDPAEAKLVPPEAWYKAPAQRAGEKGSA